MLIAAMLALLHLPVVQQQLLRSLMGYLHKTTHYHIKCDAFQFTWLRHIALEGVTVADPQDKPLFTMHLCKGRLNLFSLLLLKPNMIDSVSVTGGQFFLEKHIDQDFNMVTFYTKVILPFVPEANTDLYINKIQLHGINLYYHNQIKKQKVKVENIDLAISHFLSSSGNHSGNLTHFSYQETSDIPLVLKNMMGTFSITPHRIVLKDGRLITKYSHLQGDCTLRHTKQLPLVADQDNIELEARLHTTVLSSIELGAFADFFKGAHTLYKLDGVVSLTPYAMAWKNCKLVFGDSYIESTGCYNRVDSDVLVKAGKVYMHDLQKKPALYPTQLQYVSITNATFVGNTQKAKLTGDITTNIGTIQTDLMVHHLGKPIQDLIGKIILHKVDIEALFPSFPIQSLSGKVSIKSKGEHFNALDAVAHLTEIGTNHYNYKQVQASCMVSNAMVTFHLNSQDPNAKLTVAGSYHMDSQTSLKADGIIEEVHLSKLGFVPMPLLLSTKFSFKIRDILSKRPRGTVILNQCIVQGLAQKVACKQVSIHAIEHENKDVLTLISPFIDCKLQGTFTMNDLAHHIRHLIARLKNPVDLLPIPDKLHVDYAINCKKILPVLKWFLDDLYISPATTFWGHFAYDRDYHFSFHLPTASTLCFKKFSLENVKVKLNVGHLMDVQKRLIQLYISSDQQDWHQIFQTDHLYLQLWMDKDKFTISNRLSNHHGRLSIACFGTLTDDAIQVDLLPSRLTTKEKIWTIQTDRTSFISKAAIAIGNLSITSGQEAICIGGKLAQLDTKDPLHCTIRHLALNYASAVGPIKGIIDTKLVAHLQKDQLIATGRFSLQKATIQDYAVGTLRTKVDWNLLENKLVLEGVLQKEGKRLLQIDGCYDLPSDNLAITTTFDHMNLDLLNTWFTSVCSDINGKLSGQFQLTGSLAAPKLNGKGTIDKGTFKINYLNTYYQVAGAIQVQENRLCVNQLALYDGASGHATLSGHMVIQNGFPVMLSGHMEALHLLHTTPMHHPDFYGDLYATGTLQMEGSIYDLLLKMKITIDKGTFTIVAHDKEDIENTTKLVQFVYNKAKKQPNNAPKNGNRSAIKLMLDLTILPTIKAQVLFDAYNNKGDILKVQGTGSIQLEVGTNRKPYVMGNYLFQSGTYTVSVYSLIQKTFTIAPNSQVNFNGYPQEGIIRIGASYRQIASVAELYPESHDKRPLPVEIVLSASGTLAHPNIAYQQLLFPVKSMDFELNTSLEECASKALLDKNYLSKQILSLLIAKRVYNEKKINGWDALSNSINDLLAPRIQNLASKIDHNLEIETSLGMHHSDDQETNILQKTSIKVSYLLLSKLKLSSTMGRSSYFINDWEIAYSISKAHHMDAKFYRQPVNSAQDLHLFGISFAYTKQFW
ncbi:Translocation and assembly module subunit TamB [Cardinium endosymbiont of Oedothorax gibbosus]|nr:Translocation and assembly module subunit TamB [Cardinium endosymbiont of Oedothorax gibbosus]